MAMNSAQSTHSAAVVDSDDLELHRRELTGYCYRMLGSISEAEDAVQDTLLRAWRALPGLGDRSGLRPWLFRIATNVCIDTLRGRSRRALPMDIASAADGRARLGARRPEVTWIEPAPDSLIVPTENDPAELIVARESVRLAFVAALQHLPPRQRAVLILRDVLRWRAAEVAALLETSADAVNSSLRRARASVAAADFENGPGTMTTVDLKLLNSYIDAFDRHDVDALVALLREDAVLEMPPFELWLRGRDDIRLWLIAHDALSDHVLRPIHNVNGSFGAAVYRPLIPGEPLAAFAIHVLEAVDGRIRAIHSFLDTSLFEAFRLPKTIAG
jgi:RNA polymerase sigma-70 factor, ECF subfamily